MKIEKPLGRELILSDFEDAEAELGFALPEAYKSFLVGNNGGRLDRRGFVTEDGKVESFVSQILPLDDGATDTVVEEIGSMTQAGWLLPHLITIAKTPDDNRVVLSCDGVDRGAVYYWAWDEQDQDDQPSYDFLRRIAADFASFGASLK